MKSIDWESLKGLRKMLATSRLKPTRQAERIVAMQLHIVFPARIGVIAVVLYFLSYSGWFSEVPTTRTVVMETLRGFFLAYILSNAIAGLVLGFWRRFPPGLFQWLVFILGLLDGLFIAGLIFISEGFESIAFWVLPGLIVLNALSISLATPQIVLNLLLSFFYVSAGILDAKVPDDQKALLAVPKLSAARQAARNQSPTEPVVTRTMTTNQNGETVARIHRPLWTEDQSQESSKKETTPESVLLRVFVLWLLAILCYAFQVLAERQRRAEEEAHEMGLRQGQLRSAGRLAAEFAHQIKNPLAIINNAAFSLQRALKEGRGDAPRQLQIIQEEIERSDKIITQIMGYAQLNEGRIERLNFADELDRAIAQVFPPTADYPVKIERHCEPGLPPLLMQRNHFDEMLVNMLQNAREALGKEGGKISATARRLSENLIEISIADNGPGIPADKLGRIFEAHYTTKEKGTGLGLAIVKHNVELYAGTVRAESKLGKGARFVLMFPAKTEMNPANQR
jgi:signal transduction histidine kinase